MTNQEFKSLFKKYYAQLCAFSYSYVQDTEMAKDVVGDVFCKLFESKDKIDSNGSLRSYLYKCTANKSLDYLKHSNNKQESLDSYLDNSSLDYYVSQLIINMSDMEYDYHLMVKIVHATITELPLQTRRVFCLSREHDLSNKEISEQLNISIKTVEKHMTRALSALKAKLIEYNLYSLFSLFL